MTSVPNGTWAREEMRPGAFVQDFQCTDNYKSRDVPGPLMYATPRESRAQAYISSSQLFPHIYDRGRVQGPYIPCSGGMADADS